MTAAPPEPQPETTPSKSRVQWRLSDLLWLSFLLPPAMYFVFWVNKGSILIEHNFSKRSYEFFNLNEVIKWEIIYLIFTGLFVYVSARKLHQRITGFWARGLILWAAIYLPLILSVAGSILLEAITRTRWPSNESAAIGACKTFNSAEDTFNRVDYDRDGVLEYAQSLSELYANGSINLVDRAYARAEGHSGQPKAGYLFKVLKAQGSGVPGGKKSYLDDKGNMTQGYALVAWPYLWNVSGRNTFIVSVPGKIYQKDLGPETESIVEKMNEFDPTGWDAAE